ncbi:FadR/GntR family transcriptional regulator [Halalkalibacterium halodurans]|uniref:Transcriptional regulator (GntR family) n=2 Tax=Halalkalibacterium halodurans TaxID=86665 RepID=Q9K840_HALH5|nr:FadR/GntR family transcriptional regulator [Halalkalibacterium halodurans]MDY7223700.1 FadR/GntR family transcriptional regulator [Halalkalibacterium halodurans]MDY7242921.1 FadR/GntR family transcriptional regulator [Halalkalibacterium halodurans]MED3648013.1 FadR/GntR family transcriptional regulator [Halalkalibacterium halodurans]MED4082149.1 FadR/GntR family transcriptional regulator [Halalkalibacterium halodurans]MED4084273.1 FadR/GntR family transcriptional regulator [Halalkalibacteri
MSAGDKVYLEVIKQINQIIRADQLSAGDKLPSERELSDRLHVGRSSVREALRALELLDLIETRRGEGTFIRPANSYPLVSVILSFLLKDQQALKDLGETRRIVEIEALRLACRRITETEIQQLDELILESEIEKHSEDDFRKHDHRFHERIVAACQNRLLYNMWASLVEYHQTAMTYEVVQRRQRKAIVQEHRTIVEALKKKDEQQATLTMALHLQH